MSKPVILFLGKRYWPAHGGVETYMRQTAAAVRGMGDVVVLANAWRDGHGLTHARMYPLAPAGKPFCDPSGNLVSPLSPSAWGRLAMLPLLLMNVGRIANGGGGRFRSLLYPPVKLACGGKVDALCKNALLVHSFEGGFLAALGREAAARRKIPFVITPFVHPGAWGDDAFNVRLYAKADAVLTACEYEKAWFERAGVPAGRLAAVGGYPEAGRRFALRERFGIRGPLVLFYGRKEEYKGWRLLREAWDDVCTAERDWWLAFVGNGFEESVDREKRILTLPATDCSPVAECDVFCMPSRSETFGLVYLEAWAQGKPVIACDIPSSRELFGGERAGLLVGWDRAEIASALLRLMRDPGLRGAMGERGREVVESRYGRERFERAVREAYGRCLVGGAGDVVAGS